MPVAEGRDWIRSGFERVAAVYDRHAALENEVASRLHERVVFQRRVPERIVDLGCGTGHSTAALKQRYRKAEVVGLDFAMEMCRRTRARSRLLRPLRVVCADIAMLPLASRSADLAVAGLAFQWLADFNTVFNELRRVIRPGGTLLFSCLGPGSMRELRAACAALALPAGFRAFPDLHDIGDALVAAGFAEPVMDSETIVLDYGSIEDLLADLEGTGAALHCTDWTAVRASAETLRSRWPQGPEGRLALGWEVVYGAAFGPDEGQPVRRAGGEEATFSVEALRSGLRRR